MSERALLAAALLLMAAACGRPQPEPAETNSADPPALSEPDAVPTGEPGSNIAAPGKTAPPAGRPAAAAASVFTSLDLEGCRLVEQNAEEGGYFRHRCPATAGYTVDHVESDARQSLELRKAGQATALNLSAIAGNGAFNTLGRTIEWRGPSGEAPRTLTVRSEVDGGDGAARRSVVVVFRLQPRPCPIAVVAPGSRQSEQARAIADRVELPACLG